MKRFASPLRTRRQRAQVGGFDASAEVFVAKTIRLHTLAKELGIPSKTIMEKCKAEGIELKNHMAAISLGLAESIKEWFSASNVTTAVEVSEHVDIAKLPKRRTKKSASQTSETAEADTEESAVAAEAAELDAADAAQADSDAPKTEKIAAEHVIPEPEPLKPMVEAADESPTDGGTPVVVAPVLPPVAEPVATPPAVVPIEPVEQPAAPETPPGRIAAKTPAPTQPPRVAPKPQPVPIVPAGPQLVPKPAELRGPRIVRIEEPEPVHTPRPRPVGPRGPSFDRSGPFTPTPPAPGTGLPGRRPKARTAADEENERRKAQARNPRRHGAADLVMERMREWRDQDLLERKERLASATGHLKDRRVSERRREVATQQAKPRGRRAEIEITCPISVKDFCAAVGVSFPTLLPKLIAQTGRPMTLNQMMDHELVELLGAELGLALEIARAKTALERLRDEFAGRERKNLEPRPPVVTVLGHVDHGKTSLLDRIRQTNVVATEAGGITQHIRAYRVDRNQWHVTFIDTPGHEAFTAMRARGANLTDVVVLVVAANDGVMPQTVEAINHAKAAKVPIVVAMNKIDLPNLDQNRVLGQLAEQGLVPADWGGETDIIRTSALTGAGVDELLAHLSTLTELLDLKADPTVPAQAAVIEAHMRPGQGAVALVLVREGTLKLGDVFTCGPASGKIRSITDDAGKRLKSANPGTPVIVTGLDELPSAGDVLYVVPDLASAKAVATEIKQQRREESLRAIKPRGLEELLAAAGQGELPTLNIILRADVQGSVDALKAKLGEFSAEQTKLNVLHAGVGAVTEADVRLAQASGCLIVAYNVVAEDRARQLADSVGVEIRQYRIIYDVLEDLEKALRGMLEPETRIESRGKVEVRQIFNVSRIGTIAGCQVLDGTIARSHRIRLVRDGRIILEDGELDSLKRFKDDAREVRAGLECGVKISGFDDVKPGDIIETYEIVDVARD